MATSDMSVIACKNAMEMAGWTKDDVDLVICGTVTPDYKLPSLACIIQEKMGLTNATCFDVVAACTGFLNGLSVTNALIVAGQYKRALVVGAEKLSAFTNYNDRNTCVLFGDGAGCAAVEASNDEHGILKTYLKSDGSYRPLLWTETGGTVNPYGPDFVYDGRDKITMNGAELFKVAVKEMGRAAEKVIEEAGLTSDDIALFVPHQANIRIIDMMAKRLNLPPEKVYINIDRYGNTSAASVPIALDEANRTGRIKSGDNIVMVAFGGGLIWGAAVVRW